MLPTTFYGNQKQPLISGMILQVDGLRYPDLMPRTPHDAPVDLVIAAFAENLGDLLRKNEKVLAKKEEVNNKRTKKNMKQQHFFLGKQFWMFLFGGFGSMEGF